ncbi:hypothetical protein BGHDH14_bgh04012 [Blumeria hordei DH14]|uniref:Uncharacterized protein n=1 Tax=Blumeria graminis f. sp. hordei (strain DH14) TaxID=546991 RepID=N1JID6_BLUG1|nr:hypothetical protein BGHDH14_bgh04012 [Blumeria hordei DH14]
MSPTLSDEGWRGTARAKPTIQSVARQRKAIHYPHAMDASNDSHQANALNFYPTLGHGCLKKPPAMCVSRLRFMKTIFILPMWIRSHSRTRRRALLVLKTPPPSLTHSVVVRDSFRV